MTTSIDIYTTGICPYCHHAKALLSDKNVDFREIRVDENPELRSEMMTRSNGGYTVPQIFINDNHIGGCDDLYALERNNQLDRLLEN